MVDKKTKIKISGQDNKKKKFSTFYLTINSNKYVPNEDDEYYKEFKDEVLDIFQHMNQYIKFREGFPKDNNMIINIEPSFEISPDKAGRRAHSHTIITIKHNSNILLDTKKIQQETGFHVHSDYIRSDMQALIDYQEKTRNK